MKRLNVAFVVLFAVLSVSCVRTTDNASETYVLIDVSLSYARAKDDAVRVAKYAITRARMHDCISIALIRSRSFTDQAVVGRACLADTPSVANQQKVALAQRLDAFVQTSKPDSHTDIRGALAQASDTITSTHAVRRQLLILSDLDEDLEKEIKRDNFPRFAGVDVYAVNVIKLRKDNLDPSRYHSRLQTWKELFTGSGAISWQLVDAEQLTQALDR